MRVYPNVTIPLWSMRAQSSRGETWSRTRLPSELTENIMVGAVATPLLRRTPHRRLIVQDTRTKRSRQTWHHRTVIKNYLRNVYDKIGGVDRLELALFTILSPHLERSCRRDRRQQSAPRLAQRHVVKSYPWRKTARRPPF